MPEHSVQASTRASRSALFRRRSAAAGSDPQHSPLNRGPQLAGGLPGCVVDDLRLGRCGLSVVQSSQLVYDHERLGRVDVPAGQRVPGARQPGQPAGEIQQSARGTQGQGERGAQFVRQVRQQVLVGAAADLVPAASGELGNGRQLASRRPGGQASPGGQQPDQLVVGQPAQPVGPGVRGEASQPGACVQGVQYLSGAKPGAGAGAGVLAGQEARREDLRPGRSRLSPRPPVRLGVVRQHPKQLGVGIGRWTAVRVRCQAVQLLFGRRFIPVERISIVRRLIAR